MRSRHAVLLFLAALTPIAAGCGGDSVAHNVPETVPALTAPPAGSTTTPAAGTSTSTTATTTSTTATTPGSSSTGGTAVTPAPAPAAPAPSGTGGTATPAPAPAPTPAAPTDSGGADFNQFCAENPGAC